MFLDIDVNLASLSTLKKYIETARLKMARRDDLFMMILFYICTDNT